MSHGQCRPSAKMQRVGDAARSHRPPLPLLWALLLLALGSVCTRFVTADDLTVDFARDVLPILSDNCFQCHGPDVKEGRKGDLRLDDESDVKRDRNGHRVISVGDPVASELWQRISSTDPDLKMPPPELGRTLQPAEVERIRTWISQGAAWGRHWAFERIERPVLTDDDLTDPSAVPGTQRHPVDVLVDRVLRHKQITPGTIADKATLIRRLSLDLTGLPPTVQQLNQFLNDDRPDAWEQLVDRTLASPTYGERMAWDWLEAARYADSNGYQGDNDRTMWPWRDWVVRALNENLPFDQFTIWQLAGDLLPQPTHEQILATAFNRNYMINGEGGRIPEENRVDYVMDMTETMGTVWLGLTLNCCRCHDHKFDPLRQQDYYQFTAFFNQTPVDGGGGNAQTPPILAAPSAAQTSMLQVAKTRLEQQAVILAALEADDPQFIQLRTEQQQVEAQIQKITAEFPQVMVMQDREQLRPTFILDRGLYNQPGAPVEAAVPKSLPPLSHTGDANRLHLAQWLVSRDHPLTARVTVNRIWQMLFGIGLVKTPEDFGVQGEFPVHRELLDWLAADFMDSGWDTKRLVRTIVTSETYRRCSVIASPEVFENDPDNRLLARGARFRMPSWMIRDQALAVAGLLNAEMGGPPVYPYQPDGVWQEATFGKKTYPQSQGPDLYRRSLYTFWRRIVGPPIFFDAARRQVCEVTPLRTNTPMHALTTLNDVTYVEAAGKLAALVLQSDQDSETRMEFLSRRVYCRSPSSDELAIWNRSLIRAQQAFEKDSAAADAFLSIGAADRDPSLVLYEHAAWAALCLNLMNTDEFLTRE